MNDLRAAQQCEADTGPEVFVCRYDDQRTWHGVGEMHEIHDQHRIHELLFSTGQDSFRFDGAVGDGTLRVADERFKRCDRTLRWGHAAGERGSVALKAPRQGTWTVGMRQHDRRVAGEGSSELDLADHRVCAAGAPYTNGTRELALEIGDQALGIP